jgi:hypothetical protein
MPFEFNYSSRVLEGARQARLVPRDHLEVRLELRARPGQRVPALQAPQELRELPVQARLAPPARRALDRPAQQAPRAPPARRASRRSGQ